MHFTTNNFLGPGEVNDEAATAQYIQRLVRDHLSATWKNYQGWHPPPARHVYRATRPYVVEVVIGFLETDGNVLLAQLLRAAIKVREEDSGEQVTAADDLLRRVVDTMMGVEKGKLDQFLHDILEDLVWRDEFDEGRPSSEPSSLVGSTSGITVSLGNNTFEVPFHEVLSCFWSTRLDTACHTCHQPFLDRPPIRTIARGDSSSPSNFHLRVFNRHFSCLKERRIFFVPVSHVWDSSIRKANESETHDDEAASTLIGALEGLFEDADNAYDPGVEFWHDYFSVPQWKLDIKESLLFCLPEIYHLADEILVHMHDLSSSYISVIITCVLIERRVSLIGALKKLVVLRALCKSQWMHRMWVTLEYSQSKAACIMDQSNHIWRNTEISGAFARDTFTLLVEGGYRQLVELFGYANAFAFALSKDFLGGLSLRETGVPAQLCLGEATELIARKQCQVSRDRFLAIHVLLNREISSASTLSFPSIEIDACRWVWRDALMKGDYSPLLLQPYERIPSSNPPPGVASWLVGSLGLDGAQWGFSNQINPPQRQLIATEPILQVELDLVGQIEKVHYLDVEESGTVEGVNWVIGILISIADKENTALSPERLAYGLDRVFPLDVLYKRVANRTPDMDLSFTDRQEREPDFKHRLEEQLVAYKDAPLGGPGRYRRQDAAEKIAEILQLNKPYLANSEATRISKAKGVARIRKERGTTRGDPICEVRCPKCLTVTPFRLDLRDTGGVGDKVYRIPGLCYSLSVEDGVGLVIAEGRITGRMFHGPPACDCQACEILEIL